MRGVTVSFRGTGRSVSALTGLAGDYSAAVLSGPVAVVLTAEGYLPGMGSVRVIAGQKIAADFRMHAVDRFHPEKPEIPGRKAEAIAGRPGTSKTGFTKSKTRSGWRLRRVNRPGKRHSFEQSRGVTCFCLPHSIDEYISTFSPEVQAILEKIRLTIRNAAPGAEETISYRMPAFRLNGILVYFAAFRKHIGLYPPVRGDAQLLNAISPYARPKGNLQFPLNQPIPYNLIARIVKHRVKLNRGV